MSERCDRCGSVGEDRRTLWHACFYAMGELGLPFQQVELFVVDKESVTTTKEKVPYKSTNYLSDGTVEATEVEFERERYTAQGEANRRRFFTLRVCKRCRGEWMAAIQRWFRAIPEGEDHDADERQPSEVGSGIFVRENGAIREISREEWDRRSPGVEPVVFKLGD